MRGGALTLLSASSVGAARALGGENTSGPNTISANLVLGGGAGTTQYFGHASGNATLVLSGIIAEAGAGTALNLGGGNLGNLNLGSGNFASDFEGPSLDRWYVYNQ